MIRGFAGALVLLGAAAIFISLANFNIELEKKAESETIKVFSAHESELKKAEAESFVDNRIRGSLLSAAALPVDSSTLKALINVGIIDSIRQHGLENQGLCVPSIFGAKKIGDLDYLSLSSVTKTIVYRHGNYFTAEFFITGTEFGALFPCAEARSGNYASLLTLPLGYSQKVEVALP